MASRIPRWLVAALTGMALVAAVTGLIALLDESVPALGLGVLYLLAVVPIALVFGAAPADAVAVVGMAAFSYFFVPPRHSLDPGTQERWSVLLALLVASVAVSHAVARARRGAVEATRLAEEQAALRRVATLVARGVPPSDIFDAVAREVGLLLEADATHLVRYEHDATATGIAAWSPAGRHAPIGTHIDLDGDSVVGSVWRTERPVRIRDYERAQGQAAALGRELGLRASVGAPIVVDQRLWGVMIASSKEDGRLPDDAEPRIAAFTELLATAIANAEARRELAASRTRIVAATDAERRRVVRDLHDGAQQRLVQTIVTLKLAEEARGEGRESADALISEALTQAQRANVELRELAHGIIPTSLAVGGLEAGVATLASRTSLPVTADVAVGRLPAAVEATAYFVIAEALTNVVKHAGASRAEVNARLADDVLVLEVRDDGAGGARPDGNGLVGLADRLAAHNGRLGVDSPEGAGTRLSATIPLAWRDAADDAGAGGAAAGGTPVRP